MIEASEIAPGLWMGSFPEMGDSLVRAGFHTLALCACDHQPPTECFFGVEVARIDLRDDGSPVPHDQFWEAVRLAKHLARRVRAGRPVLVTCRHGRNRSGLVAALTLAALTGCSGQRASDIVRRRRRSPYGGALTNAEFCQTLAMLPERAPRTMNTVRDRAAAGV